MVWERPPSPSSRSCRRRPIGSYAARSNSARCSHRGRTCSTIAAMAFESKEHFRILCLDKGNHLIGDEQSQPGAVDHTPVYPREVVKRALELSATAVILVHNHPSGDPTPSRADIDMTRAIVEVARPL